MFYKNVKTIQDLFEVGMDRAIPDTIPNCSTGVALNMGCGNKEISGAIGLDYPKYDFDKDRIPYGDETISQIHAYHFLEHLKEPIRMLLEFQRVLEWGGHVNIVVPYYTSQMQAHDLDHKNQFCEETWRVLFGNPYYDKNEIEWHFEIKLNIIIGIVERNLCLMTQLRKTL